MQTEIGIPSETVMNQPLVRTSGSKRAIYHIERTIRFEFTKNTKKIWLMQLVITVIIGLFVIVNELEDKLPEDPVNYITSYLGLIDFVVMIIATTFASGIIVEDYEKQTGNLLFPKIPKSRLITGRYISLFIMGALSLGIYYLEIALLTYWKYETIPSSLWGSLGWAILYLHLVYAFVTLMSGLMNRVATATVMSLMGLLIVFNIITSIMMFTGSTIEPFFIITYYGNIITSWFNMPEERLSELSFGMGPQAESDRVFYRWSTPSPEGMVYGVILYSLVMLAIAAIFYKNKQSKNQG